MTLEEREWEIHRLAKRMREEGMLQTAEILRILGKACKCAKTSPLLSIVKCWAEENLSRQNLSPNESNESNESIASKLESLAVEIRKL